MNTALELFNIDAGRYPLPDNNNTVSYSGEILRYQGTFGTIVKGNVTKLDKLPLDPSTDKEYVYSVSGKKNSFQILNLLEGGVALNTDILTQTNAATVTRIAKVGGVYNEVFVKTANYIVPTPSLITSEDTTGGITLNSINIKSQVITGGKNIPKTGNVITNTGGLNIVLSVYNGTINKDSTDQQKIDAMKAIQGAYSGSTMGTSGVYKTMLEKTTDEDILAIAKTIISDEVGITTATVIPDTQAPVGGDFTMSGTTSSTGITLTITCPAEAGVNMYISGDITGTPVWETCVSSKNIVLTSGNGTKNVGIKWRDSVNNETGVINKIIILSTVIIIVQTSVDAIIQIESTIWESDVLSQSSLPRSICQAAGYQDVCNYGADWNYSGYSTVCALSGASWTWLSVINCNGNKTLSSNEACAITGPMVGSNLAWWPEGPWCTADNSMGYCGARGGNYWSNRIWCKK